MESCIEAVCAEIPCREKQAKALLRLMGHPETGACQSIFIYGHASTGKTLLVSGILTTLHLRHAYVNAVEAYTTRILFETILNQLTGTVPSADNGFSNFANCDNMCDFLRHLRNEVSEDLDSPTPVYVVIDNAERLRQLDPVVLAAFLRLQELTKKHICVILISEIVWEKFRCGTGFCEPYFVHFPQYSQDELVKILCSYCPKGYSEEFYTRYLHLLLSVFFTVTRNLRELQYAAQLNFPKFCAPIVEGSATESDIHKLWRNVEPHMRKTLQSVYLREVTSAQFENVQCREGEADGATSRGHETGKAPRRGVVELPFYSRFLLLAAYMASYNRPGTDRKFFVKNQGKMKRRRSHKPKEKPSNHLLGPKPFPLNRMMAIFYAIVDEQVAPSALIFSQIKTLVSLRLLVQLTKDDQLSAPKYKCLVSLDFIREIAKTVNFDVTGHLSDFNM
ncbi:origin recognition complex subunit 5 [Ixodes scapularis]|uniref:origin recognition complex subunit 5 n=1 Tax=Ixodes scapularis TaxID=6945 RepID=UPI001C394F55|nr:origin recognition complex subunit 5 [Ixodes scapularis]